VVATRKDTMKRLLFVVAVALAFASGASASSGPNATAVVKGLSKSGMPIKGYVAYTAETDPNHLLGRPAQYTSKVNFHDGRLPRAAKYDTTGGGSIETFANHADAVRRFKYVEAIAQSPMFAEYDYLNGTVLLRLSSVLTPKQAAAYKRVLLRIT
jgi:hypothetical protein